MEPSRSLSRLAEHAQFLKTYDGRLLPDIFDRPQQRRQRACGCGRILVYVEVDDDFRLAQLFRCETGLPPSHYRRG